MKHLLRRFLRSSNGATSVEYALMALILGVGIIAAVQQLPGKIEALIDSASNALTSEE